jgi:hypothetical protein
MTVLSVMMLNVNVVSFVGPAVIHSDADGLKMVQAHNAVAPTRIKTVRKPPFLRRKVCFRVQLSALSDIELRSTLRQVRTGPDTVLIICARDDGHGAADLLQILTLFHITFLWTQISLQVESDYLLRDNDNTLCQSHHRSSLYTSNVPP